jgi:c-di-GMP-binding flagellar brake protein YcgR
MQLRVVAEAGRRPYGPVWVLTPVGAAVRDQRRQYFRIPLTLPATLEPVGDGEIEDLAERTEDTSVRATLIEISEGGALIRCETGLPEVGAFVRMSFTLDDKDITVDAEVLRHKTLPNGRPSAALRFLDATAYGDHIRRYGFAAQRTLARTRLG